MVDINMRYVMGCLYTLPFIPVMLMDGRRIRKEIPDLPEAGDPRGMVKKDDRAILHIDILGESTMAGVGVKRHEQGFAGAFARTLSDLLGTSVSWKVTAQSGYNARKVRTILLPTLRGQNPDLLVIGLGGNDAFELNTPWKWRKEIRNLIGDIRQEWPDVPVVFANMPPIRDFPAFTPRIQKVLGGLVELLGKTLALEVKKHDNVYYHSRVIRLSDWIITLNNQLRPLDFFSDGIHPSQLTYEVWAKDLSNFAHAQIFRKT